MKKICTLMFSYGCNLNCVYCFEKCKSANPKKQMSLKTAQEAITKEADLVRNSPEFDALKLDIFGGEPFLRFSMIQNLCDWVWTNITDIPVEVYITTNGTLLTPKCREWIIQHRNQVRICMSVDGDTEMQLRNRGVAEEKLPLEFIHDVFQISHLK